MQSCVFFKRTLRASSVASTVLFKLSKVTFHNHTRPDVITSAILDTVAMWSLCDPVSHLLSLSLSLSLSLTHTHTLACIISLIIFYLGYHSFIITLVMYQMFIDLIVWIYRNTFNAYEYIHDKHFCSVVHENCPPVICVQFLFDKVSAQSYTFKSMIV